MSVPCLDTIIMGDCWVQGGGRAAARWVIAMHDIGNMIGIEIGNII